MKLSYRTKIGIFLLLMITFFLTLNLTPFGREVKNFFYLASSPIQKTFWAAGSRVSGFFGVIGETKELKRENQELKLKIQELLAENVALEELKRENIILREALEIGLPDEFQLISAQVTGKDIHQDFTLINKGVKDGVSEGLTVITQQKTLVGRVSEVYKNFSKVMLISNKNSSFDAEIVEKEIFALVKGKGDFRVYLDLLPREEEIKEGDLLITSALGGIFPSGLLVGEIKKVEKSDVKPWQRAEISPFFDIGQLEILFIISEW